jgi:hypothetical protein
MQVNWKKGPTQSYYEQGYTAQDRQCQPPENDEGGRKIIMPSTLVRFSLFPFLHFQLLCKFSVRSILCFYLFSACVLVVVFALNQHE